MRTRKIVRSGTALGLVAVLAALSTGLPSHHHARATPVDPQPHVVSGDHHAHGVELVEQTERVPQILPSLTAVPTLVVEVSMPVLAVPRPGAENRFRPTGRSPPPVTPRAPPRII
ncbi:MAG TPA: hypothetical protein VLA33_10710 [Gemmatimonadota bacterium]|nr:hypothetical protein [Gemmatimonadota bacterium]